MAGDERLTRAERRVEESLRLHAFDRGKVQKDGGYEVNHSSAIYVFDRQGHARVLATPATANADTIHDLKLLLHGGDRA